MLNKIETILKTKYNEEISVKTVQLYAKILLEYRKKDWKNCISTIGQFNEAMFRVIEYELTGIYIPLSNQLPQFNSKILSNWENTSIPNSEIFRIVMPRILFSMYCLRSKRGAVHLSNIDPNEIDATLLLYQVKWFLSELIRNISKLSFNETAEIIKQIIAKENDIIWNTGEKIRILRPLSTVQQVLCLLYHSDKLTDKELCDNIEYKNFSVFKSRILKTLHKKRLIEYNAPNCILSPTGISEAEKILSSL